ncbi:unnamed protein product [Nezara viridula]|uniref:Carboxylic ester hydrolase n=1 Tax=Nezara viridula TaxID=85310 RepID=A0A9P0HPD7_NEZVI|nr:unnamed protein product [Nezara viridula]
MQKTGALLLLACLQASGQRPEVTIPDGTLVGIPMTTIHGRTVSAFRNIPFAAPPVGPLRFQLPQPVRPWRIPRDAGVMAPACLQYFSLFRVTGGQEDCLYLNVFTPQLPSSGSDVSLPINVYIHGGAFEFGTGAAYGPRYLLDYDMILVTINYRLGVFGFLSTEDGVIPGNMGLKDQVAALRWVQNNIAYFGGDPTQVTISGTSAGASSVHFHFLSRMSRGLYTRGICMSGTSLMPSALQKAPLFKATTVGKLMNCSFTNTQQLANCLIRAPGSELVAQESVFYKFYGTPIGPFGPVVERGGQSPFLTQLPYETLRTGEVNNGPMLFSIVTHEGIFPAAEFLANETGLNYLNDNYLEAFPSLLDYGFTVTTDNMNETSMKIREYYFGEEPISMEYNQTIIQMAGDRTITDDVETTARLQAYVRSSPIYFYRFGYRGQNSLSNIVSGTDINWGVSHGDDTLYIFNATYLLSESTPSDRAMINIMSGMWANFTITGIPSVGRSTKWLPINRATAMTGPYNYLMIYSPNSFSLNSTKTQGNPVFWNNLPINEPGSGRPVNSFL